MKTEELIEDLVERTRQNMNDAEKLNQRPFAELNWKASSRSWSVLECLEHLNLYGDFYLPEIERRIAKSAYTSAGVFKPGLLGDYFAKSMLPRQKLNKMKTFKAKNPAGSQLDKSTINRFIDQQKKTLELLEKSRSVDLTRTRTSISITRWLKLRLGDTFRVLIYHNLRHLVQANNVLKKLKEREEMSQVEK